jgi:hypothetical protein
VEPKGKENVEAFEALVVGAKLGLGQAERMAEVQPAVHVWVGKGDHELGLGAPVRIEQRRPLWSERRVEGK